MSHAIVWVRPPVARLDLESFARAAGMHPGMVGRLVALGLLEPDQDAAGALWFRPRQLAAVARIQRLRAAFSINYASLGLIIYLLDRVAELEAALGQAETPRQAETPGHTETPGQAK